MDLNSQSLLGFEERLDHFTKSSARIFSKNNNNLQFEIYRNSTLGELIKKHKVAS